MISTAGFAIINVQLDLVANIKGVPTTGLMGEGNSFRNPEGTKKGQNTKSENVFGVIFTEVKSSDELNEFFELVPR